MDSVGRVESIKSEICLVVGLSGAGLNNVVAFSSGAEGIVFGFEGDSVQIVMLRGYQDVKKGDLVRLTATAVTTLVSRALLGRVIDPTGKPIDGRGAINEIAPIYLPIESPAHPVYERRIINDALSTGYAIIDSQIPVGFGQRELLLGERKTGQNDLAIDIICNQARMKTGTICIYVAIDAEAAPTKRRIERLAKNGALENTVVIFGRSAEAASLNYIAPMVGVTIAEWFASQGKDVLIVFDDLTRHAKVYRQLSLLLNRPASREAYPGDVFYLHSRLLERCGSFNELAGGGSITALPIVETPSEEVTDYITTNLMSITDGHILFSKALLNKGLSPPIDSGFSVSRIGSRVQTAVVRHLSDELREAMVRFAEVERFLAFGTDLNAESRSHYELGLRAQSVFYQTHDEFYSPLEQSVLLYFVVSKESLRWSNEQMPKLKQQLMDFISRAPYNQLLHPGVLAVWDDHTQMTYAECIRDFKKDPATTKPAEAERHLVAEVESISQILNDNEDVYHDKD